MSVLAVFAHPDDESFAAGGLLSLLADRGHHVRMVIATGGELAEFDSTGSLDAARAARLVRYEQALDALGIRDWSWLSDEGRWVDHPDGPRIGDDPDVLARVLRDCLLQWKPDVVVTFGSDGLTRHPDHLAIARAVLAATDEGYSPRGGVLGGVLRSADVLAARRRLEGLTRKLAVGSGRVEGVITEPLTVDVSSTHDRRRAALDAYMEGLGTLALGDLVDQAHRIGDSILLRAVFEETSWAYESFEWLRPPVDEREPTILAELTSSGG